MVTVFSFLNIFFVANIINTYLLIEADPIQRLTATQQEMARTPLNANTKPENIYFLVFDELSYQYLYEDSEVKEKFASIKKLASDSTNYHLAFAPGKLHYAKHAQLYCRHEAKQSSSRLITNLFPLIRVEVWKT